eukprot:403352215
MSLSKASNQPLPANWWLQSKARHIKTWQEYQDELNNGFLKNRFIFLDFYMQNCPWCYKVLDDFNRLIDDVTEWYGPEQVAFISIDGPYNRDIAYLFGAQSYPTFHSSLPTGNGQPHKKFMYQPRDYDTLKRWVLEILGDTPLRPGVKLPSHDQEVVLNQLRTNIDSIINDPHIAQSETVLQAFGDLMKNIGEQSIKESVKLNDIIEYYQNVMSSNNDTKINLVQQKSQEENNTKQNQGGLLQSEGFMQFMIGAVIGSLTSFILVIYLNMSSAKSLSENEKKRKTQPPGKTVKSMSVDEEKVA